MHYTTLGRTGLGTGQSADHAVGIIRQALDLEVNLIDTAAIYGTKKVVGTPLHDVPRDNVVVCTKASKARYEASGAKS